jgi:hypothetical protein
MGHPIIAYGPSSHFVVIKLNKTGDLCLLVIEQVLSKPLDSIFYLLIDLKATLTQVGPDRVLVRGVKGRAPSPWLKCCEIFYRWLKSSLAITSHEENVCM